MARPKDGGGDGRDRAEDASPRVRQPAVAGMFYPAQRDACLAETRELMWIGTARANESLRKHQIAAPSVTSGAVGAIVPHAGWICSGAIAAQSIAAIAELFSAGAVAKTQATSRPLHDPVVAPNASSGISASDEEACVPDVVVIFGAVHTPLTIEYAALDTHGAWSEPFEESRVVDEVRARLTESSGELFRVDDRFHRREHAVEVELPLVTLAWPGVAILPVEVPTVEHAWRIGVETARRVVEAGYRSPVFLASSDLTHYGPAYDFAPGGVGLSGLAWARDNDRRLLDAVERYDVERIVPEAREHLNACGAGAIAAMLAACRELGASRASMLRHANSYETLSAAGVRVGSDATDNAVGYASAVVW
jgi:AmmeMemoRadiSam system protein B